MAKTHTNTGCGHSFKNGKRKLCSKYTEHIVIIAFCLRQKARHTARTLTHTPEIEWTVVVCLHYIDDYKMSLRRAVQWKLEYWCRCRCIVMNCTHQPTTHMDTSIPFLLFNFNIVLCKESKANWNDCARYGLRLHIHTHIHFLPKIPKVSSMDSLWYRNVDQICAARTTSTLILAQKIQRIAFYTVLFLHLSFRIRKNRVFFCSAFLRFDNYAYNKNEIGIQLPAYVPVTGYVYSTVAFIGQYSRPINAKYFAYVCVSTSVHTQK